MFKYLLCLRYLMTRYTALTSIISVMLGVATMIVVNSVMTGFREKMRDRLHGILADVIVESATLDGFPHPDGAMDHIEKLVGDKVEAMTSVVEIYGLLHYRNQGRGPHMTRPVQIVGIDPKGRAKIGNFKDELQEPENKLNPSFTIRGSASRWRDEHLRDPFYRDNLTDDLRPDQGAIIGHQIATFRNQGMTQDHYLIQPGQEVILSTVSSGKPKPVERVFAVVDTYKCEMSEYDSNYVFVPIEELQQLRGMGDAVTSIQIKLKKEADSEEVVETLRRGFPPIHFRVDTWEDKQGALLQATKVEAVLINIILFFIIATAAFGILSNFFMMVVEKTRDIGILKSLGASHAGVMSIFLSYGLSLACVGCGMGLALGLGFSFYLNDFEKMLSQRLNMEIFPRDIYYFKDIPIKVNPVTVMWNLVGALLIAASASVLPARRAALLRPVEALRHE